MKLINNILYFSFNEVEQSGISANTIKSAKSKKRSSWNFTIDPIDNRKILVEYNNLKPKYKEKIINKLCNGLCPYEFLSIQQQKALEQKKEEELTREYKAISIELHKALTENYIEYISVYQKKYSNHKKAKELAQTHALYKAILLLVGENKTKKGAIQKVFEVLKDIEIPKPIKDYKLLSKHINKCRKKGVEAVVTHGNIGNKSSQVFDNYQFGMMEAYAAMPNMYSRELITELVNVHSEQMKLKKVSVSTVKTHLAKPEVKNRIAILRRGDKHVNDAILPYIPRAEEKFAGNLWMMDGTPIQFYCWDEDLKRRIRLNLFVIIDVFSRKIVGYDVSISEDRFNVINALKMSFNTHGHLPKEILHDNFSANKTDEIKTLKYELERLGVLFRAARVKNAQDKAHVERYFGTVQSTIFRLFDDYLGEGITSKRKEARADQDFTRKAVKKSDMSMPEMKARIASIIWKYNDLQIAKKVSPSVKYENSPKPNVVTLNGYEIPFLFWNRKSVTVRRSMVEIIVKHQKHYFEIYEHDLKLRLNGVKVDVRYDEKDLGVVHLFSQNTDEYICECRAIHKPAISKASQSEKDTQEILNQSAKQKSFKKYVQKSHKEVVAKGLREQGIDELQLLDPLSTDKFNVNSLEGKQMYEYYLQAEGIDDTNMNLLKSQQPRPVYYASPNKTKADELKELQTLQIKTEKPKLYIRKKSLEK